MLTKVPLDDRRHIRVVVTRVLAPPVLARIYWQDLVIRGTLVMSFSGYCKKNIQIETRMENIQFGPQISFSERGAILHTAIVG